MKIQLASNISSSPMPEGFYYISQDNYYIANLNEPDARNPAKHLYADSATSCIIAVVEGKDKDNNPIVALSHMSRPERFQRFFDIVGETFKGEASLFAQGANPPQPAVKDGVSTYAALQNSQFLISWANDHVFIPSGTSAPPDWHFSQTTFSLGLGDPQVEDRGCYGIDLGTMEVSNQRFNLTPEDRDPTGGLQTLFCVFGLKVEPKIVLPLSTSSFTTEQINLLVGAANKADWTSILNMTKDEVLNKYSSTPQYEVPWFFESLRASATYVKNYNNK